MRRFARAMRRHHQSEIHKEDAFTIIETMIAVGVVFTVLIGLLASLSSGIKGVVTGRQRTGATAVAKEVLERTRAVSYETVGHDTSTPDPTLADDDRLTVNASTGRYQFVPEGQTEAEPLVAVANPHFPEHQWRQERDDNFYDVSVYVTEVDPVVGDDYKRVTVFVAYSPEQYPSAVISNVVRLSTFLAPGGVPTCPVASCQTLALPEINAGADADSGSITVTGTLAGISLSRAEMFLPLASASSASKEDGLRETFGLARSVRGSVALTSGSANSLCAATGEAAATGATVECNGVKAETVADNDGGTDMDIRTVDGPKSASNQDTLSAASALGLQLGSVSEVVSKSAAESCPTCSPAVGTDSDGYVYGYNRSVGPGSGTSDNAAVTSYTAGILGGYLAAIHGAASAEIEIDSDPASNSEVVTSESDVDWPAIDLVTFLPSLGLTLPAGFSGAVRINAVTIDAEAQAGPTAAPPAVSGSTVNIQAWQTSGLGVGGYTTISVVPGQQTNQTVNGNFTAIGPTGTLSTVTLTTTVRSGQASTSQQIQDTIVVRGEASLTNWLTVETRLQAVQAGVTTADVTVLLEYGQVTAEAEWAAT